MKINSGLTPALPDGPDFWQLAHPDLCCRHINEKSAYLERTQDVAKMKHGRQGNPCSLLAHVLAIDSKSHAAGKGK